MLLINRNTLQNGHPAFVTRLYICLGIRHPVLGFSFQSHQCVHWRRTYLSQISLPREPDLWASGSSSQMRSQNMQHQNTFRSQPATCFPLLCIFITLFCTSLITSSLLVCSWSLQWKTPFKLQATNCPNLNRPAELVLVTGELWAEHSVFTSFYCIYTYVFNRFCVFLFYL